MKGFPAASEAAPYYSKYIDRVKSDDVVTALESQLEETVAFLGGIGEEKSLHRYAPDKWSIRQVAGHMTDTERVFVFRAFWFARAYDAPLPSFEEGIAAGTARSDDVPWTRHVQEFRHVRLATLDFFRNLPAEAWMRTGIASENPFTVRALAFITAGHIAHHTAILRERYL
jgi:hypothetical protein